VALGQYQVWGYLHLDLNQAAVSSGANTAAQQFVNYVQYSDSNAVEQSGFLRPCQMGFSRSVDAGPYVATAATC